MYLRAAPGGDRGRGRGLGRGHGRGRGGSEYGGGSERGGHGSSDYGRGRGNLEAGRGLGHGNHGAPYGGADRGGPRGRGFRGRGRGGVVETSSSSITLSPAAEVGGDLVEAGSALPTYSSGPTGPLPAEHVEATGVKRRKFGNAGRFIRLRSNHIEVKLDQKMLYQYDVFIHRRGRAEESQSIARNHQIIGILQTEVEARLTVRPGVYDGRKNLFTSFELELESDPHEYVVPMSTGAQVEGAPPPAEYTVRLSLVQKINPEVLQRFVRGEQSMDNDVLTAIMALNVAVRMAPSLRYPSNARSFFTDQETKNIAGGVVLWRGYFQSVRPAINRILINIDISTGAMYQPGNLISLCLDFLGKSGQTQALNASRLPDRERMRLRNFLRNIKVTTPYRTHNPNRGRLVKRLTSESARERTFDTGDGDTVTVMQYFHTQLNRQLLYPDLICVELASGAVIPLELCEVPPGQLVRQEMSPDQIRGILGFSGLAPRDREKRICDGLGVLQYGQSQYVREFGMDVPIPTRLVELDGRIITAPRLNYNQRSRKPNIRPENGVWNMLDRFMSEPVEVKQWILIIYEGMQRFNKQTVRQMITDFVKGCVDVGIKINHEPAHVKWESGQGTIAHQLSAACNECQRKANAAPTLIVAILPEGGSDIYTSIKNFGDVTTGIATQCMKASKCFNAKPQYFANITLKVNMKLGGINVEPDPRDVSWLTDPANPTIIMGGDMSHPPPGSRRGPGGYPSYTSLVGSINSTATKYVSIMGVQDSLHELIEDLESMCIHIFKQYREAMKGKLPKRILFYRDGVSEGEFRTVIKEEINFIRDACAKLDFNPTITFIVVTKKHKVVFFPASNGSGDPKGNCRPGTVIDSDVVSPVETDYYLYGHAGILGTSKPAHYNVLLDENDFTPDGIQSLSYALCHVYARCTRSVSLPAPIYYAHNVCTRARNHYDPQHIHQLFSTDMAATEDTSDRAMARRDRNAAREFRNEFQSMFQQAHEHQACRMYFL